MEGGYCDTAAQPDQCKDAVQFLIPLALPLLASQPRDWVDQVGSEKLLADLVVAHDFCIVIRSAT